MTQMVSAERTAALRKQVTTEGRGGTKGNAIAHQRKVRCQS